MLRMLTLLQVVDRYLAQSLGFSQLTIGLLLVILTGSLPLTSMVESMSPLLPSRFLNPRSNIAPPPGPSEAVTPFTNAAILISTFYHAAFAFNAYGTYNVTAQTGYLLGAVGAGLLASFGLFNVMFANEKGHLSNRTGADKRTSGFPFKNAESDKRFAKKEI